MHFDLCKINQNATIDQEKGMEFSIVSPSSSTVPVAVIGVIIFLLVIVSGLVWLALALPQKSLSVFIEGKHLKVDVPIYGRTIPLTDLSIASAVIADFSESSNFMPKVRTNGIALPSYSVGWFRLRNGQKALLALTSKDKVLYMPTIKNYALLLSLDNPEQFLNELRKVRTSSVL